MTFDLVLPLPPNVGNPHSPGAYRQWNTLKQRYTQAAVARIREQLNPVPRFTRADYTADLYTAKLHDFVNRVMLLKWAEDAIVEAGIVPDDKPQTFTMLKLPNEHPQGYVRRGKREALGDWTRRRRTFHREHYRIVLHITGEETAP